MSLIRVRMSPLFQDKILRLALGSSISNCGSTEVASHIPDVVSSLGLGQACLTDILFHSFPNFPKQLAIIVTFRFGFFVHMRRPRRFLGRAISPLDEGPNRISTPSSARDTLKSISFLGRLLPSVRASACRPTLESMNLIAHTDHT